MTNGNVCNYDFTKSKKRADGRNTRGRKQETTSGENRLLMMPSLLLQQQKPAEGESRVVWGRTASLHAGRAVIILISPFKNLNGGPKLSFATDSWVLVLVCTYSGWVPSVCTSSSVTSTNQLLLGLHSHIPQTEETQQWQEMVVCLFF